MPDLHVLLLPSWYPTDYLPARGMFFQEQALALLEEGVRIGVIYADFRSLRTLKHGKILSYHFQVSRSEENGIFTLRFHGWNTLSARLRAFLSVKLTTYMLQDYIARWGRPDLIHAHSVLWAGVAARDIYRQLGIPYVITEHSSGYARGLIKPWQQHAIRDALAHAAAILAVSQSLAQTLLPYLQQDHDSVEVVPNVADTAFFSLNPALRSKSPFSFLTVAFLKPNKGIDILLRAFASRFRKSNGVVLEIGGDGPQQRVLERLAIELRIADKVKFLGYLDHNGVRQAMWRANVFVLPSYVETFGVVFIEAMATGLPVIGSRSGGPEEIISPHVGLLIEPGDVDALAQAMERVKEQRHLFADDSEIRYEATRRYDKKVVAERLLEIYRRTLRK
ncbi:MAG: glycosyltransferase family 4 protein [Chloroflexi bacterium]|nr:glycosyltransferase family 4 protein [Chloroflexota bacterium]